MARITLYSVLRWQITAIALSILLARPGMAQDETPAESDPPSQRSKLDAGDDEAPDMPDEKPASKSKLDDNAPEETAAPESMPQADEAAQPATKKDRPPGGGVVPAHDGRGPIDPRLALCDWLVLRNRTDVVPVQLMSKYVDVPSIDPAATYVFYYYKDGVAPESAISWKEKGGNIKAIEYYERRVLNIVCESLEVPFAELTKLGSRWAPSTRRTVKNVDDAMKKLKTALDEHDSAVQRSLRDDYKFKTMLRQPLLTALYNLRLAGSRSCLARQAVCRSHQAVR